MSDVVKALNEINAHFDDFQTAEDFYDGNAPELFASSVMRRAVRGNGKDFQTNWCKPVVTAVLNRLEITSVSCTDKNANDELKKIRDDNLFAIESRNVHEKALTYGEAYVTVWYDDEEDKVTLDYNSPKSTRAFYNAENPRKMEYVARTWDTDNDLTRVDLYYPEKIVRYISTHKLGSKFTETDFELYRTEDAPEGEVVNPYGQIPIIHFGRNGTPEHYEAYGPQNSINKHSALQHVSADITTFPQRYAYTKSGVDKLSGGQLDFGDDENETPSDNPNLVVDPGVMQFFKNVDGLGTFAAADPKTFIEPIREAIQNISSVTGTPIHVLMIGGTPPSGESRKVMERPLIAKVENRQLTFGAAWVEVFKFALKIRGIDTTKETVTVTWGPADNTDSVDDWNLVAIKVANGVPRRVALRQNGISDEELDKWFGPEVINDPGLQQVVDPNIDGLASDDAIVEDTQ